MQANSVRPLMKVINVLLLLAMPIAASAQTDNPASVEDTDWWFDVEVIAFQRSGSSQIEEDFSKASFVAEPTVPVDLLSYPLYRKANPLVNIQKMAFECIPEVPEFPSTIENALSPLKPFERNQEVVQTEEDIAEYTSFDQAYQADLKLWSEKLQEQRKCDETREQLVSQMIEYKNVDSVPVYLEQAMMEQTHTHHLLSDEQFYLQDYAKRLFAQRDVQALAHIAWRQPVVFGEENAKFYRVFAGKRLQLPPRPAPSYDELKDKYEPDTNKVIDQNSETFFEELKAQLASGNAVDWVNTEATQQPSNEANKITRPWELDGQMKVYLKYINRVPYLHIEAEFMHVEMKVDTFGDAYFEQYPFKQRRRIISKQIHYFDHPKFGFVVRLQRFEFPKEELED